MCKQTRKKKLAVVCYLKKACRSTRFDAAEQAKSRYGLLKKFMCRSHLLQQIVQPGRTVYCFINGFCGNKRVVIQHQVCAVLSAVI